MREKSENALDKWRNDPYVMFTLVRQLNIDNKGTDRGRCVIDSDEKLCYSKKE